MNLKRPSADHTFYCGYCREEFVAGDSPIVCTILGCPLNADEAILRKWLEGHHLPPPGRVDDEETSRDDDLLERWSPLALPDPMSHVEFMKRFDEERRQELERLHSVKLKLFAGLPSRTLWPMIATWVVACGFFLGLAVAAYWLLHAVVLF